MPSLPDDLKNVDSDVLRLISPEVARNYKALPLRMRGNKLLVAVADAADARTLRAIQFATERAVEPLVVAAPALEAAIQLYYAGSEGAVPIASDATSRGDGGPPVEASDRSFDDLGFDNVEAALPDDARGEVGEVSAEAIDRLDELFAEDSVPTVDLSSVAAEAVAAATPLAAPTATTAERPKTPAMVTSIDELPTLPAPPKLPPPVQQKVARRIEQVDAARLAKPSPEAIGLISADTARNYHALPIELEDGELVVAFKAAPEVKAVRALQYASGKIVRPVVAPGDAVDDAILRHYPPLVPKAPLPHNVPRLDPKFLEDRDPDVLKLLRADVARKHRAIAIERMGRRLTVAMVDPTDLRAIQELEFVAGIAIKAVACDEDAIAAVMDGYYPDTIQAQADRIISEADHDVLASVEVQLEEDDGVPIVDLGELTGDEAPAVRLSNMLIRGAVARGASDIHIESYENGMRVRYRVDGILSEVSHPPLSIRDALVSRIKVVSKMDISENRMPQDGRLKMRLREGGRLKALDFRVSVMPTIWGQKIVMRILDPDKLVLDLTKLGFDAMSLGRFEETIKKPYGMALVVGPSGSGKTNTLYSAMSAVNDNRVNIMTAEDPVEFNIKGINQVQVHEGVGMTFAAALRSFLRQDPNIILVGEIRDFETAEMAIKASLTGHLVLSTLHTTDAPTTVSRLINMGIEPFLVASSLLLVSAQRLVRVSCKLCRVPDPRPESELLSFGFSAEDAASIKPMKGEGCKECHMTGYRGRTALFEVLQFSDQIRELVLQGATPTELKQVARQEGMLTLRDSGMQKIREGATTIDEVDRETMK